MAILDQAKPEPMQAAADREIKIKAGPTRATFSGSDYLLHFALPNFYFHCATAYGLLRHSGVSSASSISSAGARSETRQAGASSRRLLAA